MIVGTVRLWNIRLGENGVPALLLGPLAVDPALKGEGIGSALMRRAIVEAQRLGHRAILLVGDASYYGRFAFQRHEPASCPCLALMSLRACWRWNSPMDP